MRIAPLAGLALAAFTSLATAAEPLPPVVPFPDTSRVVSIGGSLTEIIYALGEEGHLVARDTTGNYPEAATKLPDVGYMRALSAEGVLSVNPTAILAIQGSGPADALNLVAKAGVPFNQVPEAYSGDGIVQKVLDVGTALGVPDRARTLADKLGAELTALEQLTSAVTAKKRVLFVLSVQDGKLMASGTSTAANGVIGMAGAVNAIDAYQGYKSLNDEAVIAAQPDAILVMDNAGDASATDDRLMANAAVQLTPAGKNHAIIHMDGEYLLGFGPRTPDAVTELVHRLYPDLPAGK